MTHAIIRPAPENDLAQVWGVYYQTGIVGEASPPAPGSVPAELRHEFVSGRMVVAVIADRLCGYATVTTRRNLGFLSSLFVLPDVQSTGLGTRLLHEVLPADEGLRCTLSSADPRALSLYIRSGMQPQWPVYYL